jgi:hypothetical protein
MFHSSYITLFFCYVLVLIIIFISPSNDTSLHTNINLFLPLLYYTARFGWLKFIFRSCFLISPKSHDFRPFLPLSVPSSYLLVMFIVTPSLSLISWLSASVAFSLRTTLSNPLFSLFLLIAITSVFRLTESRSNILATSVKLLTVLLQAVP